MVSQKFNCCCGGEEFRKETAFSTVEKSPLAVEGISSQSRIRKPTDHHGKGANRLEFDLCTAHLPKGSSASGCIDSTGIRTNNRPISAASRSTLILGGYTIGDGSSHTTSSSGASDVPKSDRRPMINKRKKKKLLRRVKRG
jgi:hypothetical protein